MRKQSYRLLIIILLGIVIYSCRKEDEILPLNEENINQIQVDGIIKLGKKLENPYSVENMQRALENLKKSNVSAKTTTSGLNVETTHLYVKFIPKNEDELSILKRDPTFVLYEYPLDYEIAEGGYFYRDPEVPKGQPTYQYCAVKVDKKLPSGVENEILEELFIPDEDNNDDATSRKAFSYGNVEALVDEALRITNNLPNTDLQNQKSLFARRSKWRPAGTIRVWDDNFSSWIGVEGVEVRARRWFTTHKGIANSSGYYSCDGRFRRDANYSIDWERYHFALQDGWLNGATYNGPKKKGNWDLNLNSGAQQYYATIFRAAYHYYYKDIKGLRRPPQNSFWKTQMKIKAALQDEGGCGGSASAACHTSFWRAFGLYSPIRIYTYQRPAIFTYATTIHELAHASHWKMENSITGNFNSISSKVKESWARGVQWELGRMTYPNYLGREFETNDYTLVVSDMIDDDFGVDEDEHPRTNKGYYNDPNDQVSGYTIRQIEDALVDQKTWNDWRDNIIRKYTNSTEDNLNRLFRAYE
jgi:hypothetical protein